jgi:hypothetical protein
MPPPRPPINAPRLPLGASGLEPRVAARGEAVSPLTVGTSAAPAPAAGNTPPPCANAWRLLMRGVEAASSSFGPGTGPCASPLAGPNKLRGEAAAKTPSPPSMWPLPLRACVPAVRTSPSRAFWLEEDAVGAVPKGRCCTAMLPAPGLPPAPGANPAAALGLPVRSSSPTAVRPRRSVLSRDPWPLGVRRCSPPTATSGAANTPGVGPLGANSPWLGVTPGTPVVSASFVRPQVAAAILWDGGALNRPHTGQDGPPPRVRLTKKVCS